MARFLHRAKEALGCAYRPGPFSGLFLASASRTAFGHLGLARASATPALRDLLIPGPSSSTPRTRSAPSCFAACPTRARAEAQGDAKRLEVLRLRRAIIDAEDGRCEDALDDLTRLAAESPDRYLARLCAAAFCNLLGRVDEADRWLAGIPAERSPREHIMCNLALVAAALGGAPGTVAGSRGRVASAAFQIMNVCGSDGQMSAFETIITGLLKHAAKRRCKDLLLNHGDDGILRALADAFALSGSVPKDHMFFVLKASQALLSAVVLRAHPLSSERVRAAVRIAERDLARAVEEGDAAAACDLRLLLAFLAARDRRFDDALARYQEVARDDPSDSPAALTGVFNLRAPTSASAWGSSFPHRFELMTLTEELVVALAIASPVAFDVRCPVRMRLIVPAAGSMVDAALVSALRTKNMSVVEWMEKWEGKDCGTGSGTTTE
uniref:Uncharacterized protein n=1 Tax=Setaria italica TaxID=4555 RepID=K3XSI9_SETIT